MELMSIELCKIPFRLKSFVLANIYLEEKIRLLKKLQSSHNGKVFNKKKFFSVELTKKRIENFINWIYTLLFPSATHRNWSQFGSLSRSNLEEINFLIEVNLKACIQFNHVEVEEFCRSMTNFIRNSTKSIACSRYNFISLRVTSSTNLLQRSNLVKKKEEKRVHLHVHIGKRGRIFWSKLESDL